MTKRPLITSDIATRIKKYDGYTTRQPQARTRRTDDVVTSLPQKAKAHSRPQAVHSLDLRPKPRTQQVQAATLSASDEKRALSQSPQYAKKLSDIVTQPKLSSKKSAAQQQPAVKQEVEHIKLEKPDQIIEEFMNQEKVPESDIPVEVSLPQAEKKSRFAPGGLFVKLFYGFGVMVFVSTMAISAQAFVFNVQTKTQADAVLSAQTITTVDDQGVEQGTGSEPTDEKPDDEAFFAYRVDPEKPRFLRIPSQSTYSRVKHLGDTADGAVDAPWNIHDTGWYHGSVLPGSDKGVSLILGHVSGWSGPGVFKNIGKLTQSQIVEVEKGSGDVVAYEVEKVVELPVEQIDMGEILYQVPVGEHSLRLMTCSGSYDRETEKYSARTIVYASPIK